MKKGDIVQCSHEDGLTQIFGLYVRETGGDSGSPPDTFSIRVEGIRNNVLELEYNMWKIERVLPHRPGATVKHAGSTYVLIGHSQWTDVKSGAVADPRVLVKDFELVHDGRDG